jgi:hypothetical protein
MATCDPNTLMERASGFASLPSGMLRIVKLQLMREIIGGVQDSPQILLDRASCFSCLSPGLLRVLKLQLWCEILGGGSGCVAPAVPVLAFGSYGLGTVSFTWTEAADPSLDFLFQWGTTLGGPYPNQQSFLASSRSGDIVSVGVIFTRYAVIQARNSLACVSVNSNEINF